MPEEKFSVDFFSDSQYESLTAEISFAGQILCQINKDQGVENMEIEFFHEQRMLNIQPRMKFPLSEFLSIVGEVKSELEEIDE